MLRHLSPPRTMTKRPARRLRVGEPGNPAENPGQAQPGQTPNKKPDKSCLWKNESTSGLFSNERVVFECNNGLREFSRLSVGGIIYNNIIAIISMKSIYTEPDRYKLWWDTNPVLRAVLAQSRFVRVFITSLRLLTLGLRTCEWSCGYR
jgi:hypothetical protein